MVAAARFSVNELTRRQLEVLEMIRAHVVRHGYPPTLREIGRRFGIRSTNGVECHLRALEKKGRIARAAGGPKSRTITVTGYPAGAGLRLLGLVAAGPAVEAEPADEVLDLRAMFGAEGARLFRSPRAFPARQIAAGDLLVLRPPGKGDAGRTVAAAAGGAVGMYHYLPRRGGVRLTPADGEGAEAGPDAVVLGVLDGVIRRV